VLIIAVMSGFQPMSWPQLPFFFRYDALVILVLAWGVCWPGGSSRNGQRFQSVILWSAIGLLIFLTALNLLVIRALHVPLTYRLVVISDRLRGLHGAIGDSLLGLAILVTGALLLTTAVAAALRQTPSVLVAAARWFFSWPAALALAVMFSGMELWAERHLHYPAVSSNPLWTFVMSLGEFDGPVPLRPTSDHRDFLPESHSSSDSRGPLTITASRGDHPLNVVLIVMESIGAKWLRLYGAPYQNSPEIERLAERGAVFSRVYASAPNTSSAMAALFCSVYPLPALRTVTAVYPALQIQGLPAVLAGHGYRTAFVHGGDLSYDDERNFLKTHGFAEVIDNLAPASMGVASEAGTLTTGLQWLSTAASQPFFLTLWTVQTHFSYHDDTSVIFGTNDWRMERYLNGVLAADHLVGEFVRAVDRLGLAGDTIFIVTGDHGESFGLHGKAVHGFEIYNEEAWVPLVIVAPGVSRQTVTKPVRQIDLAPTILAILGFHPPAEWQGVDLTVQTPPPRTYLFTGWSDFTVGMIEDERKSIFHFPSGTSELYDVRSDPDEKNNLATTRDGVIELARSRQRIDGWIGFQASYLARFK
jgi:arylsulfatase A-like enzyme